MNHNRFRLPNTQTSNILHSLLREPVQHIWIQNNTFPITVQTPSHLFPTLISQKPTPQARSHISFHLSPATPKLLVPSQPPRPNIRQRIYRAGKHRVLVGESPRLQFNPLLFSDRSIFVLSDKVMYSIQVPKLKFIVSLFSGFQTNRLLHFRNNSSGSCSDGLLDWKSLGRFLDRVDNCGPRGEARGSAGCAVFDFWFWGHGERFWRYVLDSRIYVEELWGMRVLSKGHKDITLGSGSL
jgi:hypothetical protein